MTIEGGLKDSAYNSPRDLMEQALGSERGIRVRFVDRASAQSMKNRMATVVTQARKMSRRLRSPDEPGYGTSPYDGLSIYIVDSWAAPGVPEGQEAKDANLLEWTHPWVWLYICPEYAPNTGRVVETL